MKIEEWIEENNPYKEPKPEMIWNAKFFAWEEGAVKMAEHLEERSREENDAAFLLGMEAAKGVQLFGIEQPPTDEQIDRFLQLYCEYCCCPSADLKIYPTAKEFIIKKWNDE